MKKNYSVDRMISRLCAIMLAFLGFGCDEFGDDNYPLMYGTPSGSWEVKGEVTDEENRPVPDATIKITLPQSNSSLYPIDVVKTNETGTYLSTGRSSSEALKIVCIPANPELDADSTIVTFKYSGEANGMWNMGHANATADFKLRKKTTD